MEKKHRIKTRKQQTKTKGQQNTETKKGNKTNETTNK